MVDPLAGNEQVQNLRKLFAASEVPNDPKAWDKAWVDATTPWDANRAQPALVALIAGAHDGDALVEDGTGQKVPVSQAIPSSGTAVVAGCGRGYDAKVFAERGLKSYGVDISSSAVTAANKWLEDQNLSADLKSKITFAEADFFTLATAQSAVSALAKPGAASLAYDYTFLCAIPPSLRTSWAETYTRLVGTDGVLIALVFPIHGDRPGGPPFSISPELVRELLGGQKKEDGKEAWKELAELKPKGEGTRPDVERIMVWRRL
ncbi:TPMT family [Kalmanozyma brasiliensis GHG001]|uniref:S-adenosyl-L-methionine-dependent methyltransferase n=1 Tax=Kalmanozyma brasiliensis (strain GHG001) TaxID=1365824 RepID=V5EGJ7_KALBG|nr:TPMT family [Kalmanozyma brasiliensis GHG001]EST09666.1 TPMT family [Kalmanozyma brasiliensis GHG001]